MIITERIFVFQAKNGTQTRHVIVSDVPNRGKIYLQQIQFSICGENVRWQILQRVIRQVSKK